LAVEGKELTMQQDLFLNNEIDEAVQALKFIPLTSAEKVLDARIIKPTADGIVTWGDGFVSDLNYPQGPMRHLAKHIAWDFLDSMRPYWISADISGKKYCERKNYGWIKFRIHHGYYHLNIPRKITLNKPITNSFHAVIWDIYRPEQRIYSIDHMDGNSKNNNFYNLRMTNNNSWNSCNNNYRIPGVSFFKETGQWRGVACAKKISRRWSELEAARDRALIMGRHPDCQPSDIEAFIRRTLTALAYRERHHVNATGKTVALENLGVRVPEWLSYPVEHFLKHQPALQS
jgi:hypothetical protein